MSLRSLTTRDYFEDMLEMCDHLIDFTTATTEIDFFGNVMMQLAVIRCLEVIGEASKQLLELRPDAIQRFPAIPFKRMYATRNRLTHGYGSIDLAIIWDIVQDEIPALRRDLQAILSDPVTGLQ